MMVNSSSFNTHYSFTYERKVLRYSYDDAEAIRPEMSVPFSVIN